MKDKNKLIWHGVLWVSKEITNELWVSLQASWLKCFPSPYLVLSPKFLLLWERAPPPSLPPTTPTTLDKQYTDLFIPKVSAREKKWRKSGTGTSAWYFSYIAFLLCFHSAGLTVRKAFWALPFSVSVPCPCLVWTYVLFIELSTRWFRTELRTTAVSALETLCCGPCV